MSLFQSTLAVGISDALTNRFQIPQSSNIVSDALVRMEMAVPALELDAFDREDGVMTVLSQTPAHGVGTRYSTIGVNGLGDNWFNRLHVLPRTMMLGNILTTLNRSIEIYNAYLTQSHDLEAFINNAGSGVSIIDLPILPFTIFPQESLLLTLEVTPDGPSTIDTTLDFDTDEPYLLSIPITGTRIVMFPYEPEAPLTEVLKFLTDVMEHVDGTEQRVGLRLCPRQEFEMKFIREDGVERQRVDLVLFDWQSRVFGLPIWIEPSIVTAAITNGQTSVSVDTTAYGDFRAGAGNLAIIFESETKFDALEIESFSSNTINFLTPILHDYAAGVRVMPLRTAIVKQSVRESKHPVNLAEFVLTMSVIDNNADLGSTSGWPTYNSKVLLSDPNAIERTLDGSIIRQVTVFDSMTGKFSQASTWDRSRHSSAKTFLTRTRAGLWAVRKLLHALRGRQVSFYLPTFTKDITLASTYASGGSSMIISNVGFTLFAQQRTPKMDIRVILTDGTTFVRSITNSSVINEATESITLSSSIAQTLTPAQIARIEFLEKVRMDSDDIRIEHSDDNGQAKIGFPVKVCLE